MNMVSLLALPLVILHNVRDGVGNVVAGAVIAIVALIAGRLGVVAIEAGIDRSQADGSTDGEGCRRRTGGMMVEALESGIESSAPPSGDFW